MKSKLTFRPFGDVGEILNAMSEFDRSQTVLQYEHDRDALAGAGTDPNFYTYSLQMHYRDGKWTYRKTRR